MEFQSPSVISYDKNLIARVMMLIIIIGPDEKYYIHIKFDRSSQIRSYKGMSFDTLSDAKQYVTCENIYLKVLRIFS